LLFTKNKVRYSAMSRLGFLKPIDALSVVFIAMLLALAIAFSGRIPDAGLAAARYAAAIFLVILSSYAAHKRQHNAVLKYIHVFMPLFIVLFTFDSLSRLTHYVNPADMDPVLARLDERVFGVTPGVWMERFINPVLTTVLQLCYASYYFLPVALGLILYFKNENEAFDRTVFGIVLGFFISYVGYLLVPALGPRFYLNGQYDSGLMRGHIATAVNDTLNMLEGENRDAFPSGHTEVVLIVLYYAWTYKRWYFWLALPLVTGLIISTVYLRYHYAVDVVAGMILAPVSVWAAGWLYEMYVTCQKRP
jgi:membrane-associated phospholipid phosphatase